MVTTQKQITDRLISTAESHKMVSQVKYGFLTDADDLPEITPPTIYIVPGLTTVPREGVFQLNYQLICMDLLLPDKSNLANVLSDCHGILIDIYSKLLYIDSNDSWGIQTGTTITPFQERFKDYCGGYTMSINITTFQSNCIEPLPFD